MLKQLCLTLKLLHFAKIALVKSTYSAYLKYCHVISVHGEDEYQMSVPLSAMIKILLPECVSNTALFCYHPAKSLVELPGPHQNLALFQVSFQQYHM